MRALNVCVVGAGVIGAATAYELAARGARVSVVDATAEPRGASYASFAWTNASSKQPEHYFELNRDGLAAHHELARTLGDGGWLHGGGSLEWAEEADAAKLRTRVATQSAQGYPAEMIDADQARQMEPDLQVAATVDEFAYFAAEGWVDSLALIERLLGAAQAAGAVIRRGVEVESVDPRGAVLADGSRVEADVVVNCAGPYGGWLAASGGLAVDTVGPIGLNAVTEPGEYRLGRVIRAPGVHFRPETGGRLMVASPALDSELEAGANPDELAQRVVDRAARHVPALAGARVAQARVARRAIPPDGLPMIGRLPEVPWMYHVITHSGVTLAPLLGRLVASELVDGTEHERLAPYRPARFATAAIP